MALRWCGPWLRASSAPTVSTSKPLDRDSRPELIDPAHVRHIVVSPRQRAQITSKLLFENNVPPECSWTTDPDVAEWDYGAYEGMLTKDIRKIQPGWDIWRDG